MKRKFLRLCTAALLLFLTAGAAEKASADVIYDARGIPVWGYGTSGRAVYSYIPGGLPVYASDRVYSGCSVPAPAATPRYRGVVVPVPYGVVVPAPPHLGGPSPMGMPGGPGGPHRMGRPGGPGGPGHMGRPGGRPGHMGRPGGFGGRPGGPRR